jgi:hypothetical protein
VTPEVFCSQTSQSTILGLDRGTPRDRTELRAH